MKDNCVCTPNKVDYIISYRESSVDRKKSLLFVVQRLHQAFPEINIIIVEQDSQRRLVANELPYCQLIFVFNAGLFNRGWSNNVAVQASCRPYVVFADCDIFLEKNAYESCFSALQIFDAVDPKKSYITNVSLCPQLPKPFCEANAKQYFPPLSSSLALPDTSAINSGYTMKNRRYGNTFAGGIFCIRRQSLLALGMWDEHFEGWGGEDNVMDHVIRLFLRQCRLQLEVLHIDHSRTHLDTRSQPAYQANRERCQQICSVHGPALLDYIREKRLSEPGAVNKYRDSHAYLCSSPA